MVEQLRDTDNEIIAFVAATDNAIGSSILLAEKRISEILKSIASSNALISQFRTALKGYDKDEEFRLSKVKVGGRGKLNLPQTQVKLMAYAFCLLMDIDSGKISLRELLDEYFYHVNHSEQYALFTQAILVPFRDVTEYVFYNGVDAYEEGEGVDATLRDSVKRILQEVNTIVSENSTITVKTKQDLFALAKGIESALTPNRIDLVKPLLIGFKNTVVSYPIRERLAPYIDKLYKILTTADVL